MNKMKKKKMSYAGGGMIDEMMYAHGGKHNTRYYKGGKMPKGKSKKLRPQYD